MKDKELIANIVGVGALDDPHFEENALKEYQNKSIENAVGVAPLGDPHFEENTPASSKACSNPNSKPQTLTSNVAITLIALVITIIVMLILVGVSVSIAINGGLFSTAKKAVTKTEEAKDSELRFMAMANAATHDKEWVYEVEGEKIPIPAGFAPTEIEGENSLEEGIVITDAEGNEFVWIPCTKTDYEGANREESWPTDYYEWDYGNRTWTDEQVENVGEVSLGKLSERHELGELTSQGIGFYVARYEAGVPENADFYADSEGDTYYLDNKKNVVENEDKEKYKPVSKKGYPAWNFINQTNAKTVSENMYSGMSYLIDSHAWNYICQNILAGKAKKNITDSHDWGNYVDNIRTKYENLDVLYALHEWYNNSWTKYADGNATGDGSIYHKGIIPAEIPENNYLELSTGASDDFKAYNIYDMAGNMWEFTTETETDKEYSIARGGGYGVYGSWNPVTKSNAGDNIHTALDIGFRIVLYL